MAVDVQMLAPIVSDVAVDVGIFFIVAFFFEQPHNFSLYVSCRSLRQIVSNGYRGARTKASQSATIMSDRTHDNSEKPSSVLRRAMTSLSSQFCLMYQSST